MNDFYWPRKDEPGTYDVAHCDGKTRQWEWTGNLWQHMYSCADTKRMMEMGYLGVRCEQAATEKPPDVAPFPIATAQQALDKWRLIQCKPAEVNHFAYEWIPELCRRLGAK